MQPLEPIRLNHNGGPGDFALPIEPEWDTASSSPVAKSWWQWVPPQTGTSAGYWAVVTKEPK